MRTTTHRFVLLIAGLTTAIAASGARAAEASPVSAGISTQPPPAAQNGDEVVLADGSTLRGTLIQQVVGTYVMIRTDDGRTQTIAWSQIKRVSAATAPVALPAALPVAPAPAVAAATPATPASTATPAPTLAPVAMAVPESATQPRAAEQSLDVNFELGARAAYAFADGDYATGTPVGSSASGVPATTGAIPFTIDLGMRLASRVYVGGFLQYAILNTSCPSAGTDNTTLSCSGHDLRGGIAAQLHVIPRGHVDPWFGFGVGHEWLTLDMSATAASVSAQASQTLDGWNFVDLTLGLDVRSPSGLGIGPYLEFTSGSFASTSGSATASNGSQSQAQSSSGDITSPSAHQWFVLGVRGTYELGAAANGK
jgi:hypothetical protein